MQVEASIEWVFGPDPPAEPGWYAVALCWDPHEGIFPGVARFGAAGWETTRPMIVGHAGPFGDEAAADAWAQAHEPEG